MELLVWLQRLRRFLTPPEEDDALRRYVVVVLAFSHIVTAFCVLTYYLTIGDILKARGWYYMVVLAYGIALFILRDSLGASQTRFFLAAFMSFMFVFILSDLRQGGVYEQWTFSVCFMDILLLTKCRPLHINIAMATTIVYLLVIWAEQSFNLGLYDAMRTATPDCAGSDRASFLLALRVFVILFDFFMTRGFATSMEEQKQRALKGIETAQAVTKALEAFDLEEASHSLASLHDVDLKEAFKGLIANLHMYRPYLPDVLFSATPSQTSLFRSTHPGKDGGTVALVFTDIQSSTALWERFPLAMSKALRIHNDTIRRCIHEANGYEVKTVGDSFMVAFDTVLDAATFCLSAQEQLYAAEWPAEMQTHPLCQRVDGAWNGLRVRMGLNCGEMEVQINPLTGRADYFGTEVNKAARLEGVALGGTVALPEDVAGAVQNSFASLGHPVTRRVGFRPLKGLEQECMVWQMVPKGLEQRLTENTEHVALMEKSLTLESPTEPSLAGLQLRFRAATATIGHVRVSYRFQSSETMYSVNDMVTAVADAADRTDGSILSMCSGSMVVGWNIGRNTNQHLMRGVRFACILDSAVHSAHGRTTVGLAVGKVLNGNVGSSKQRFATVISPCVEIAGALSAAATNLPLFSLVSIWDSGEALIGNGSLLEKNMRRLDEWEFPSRTIAIYEVRLEAFTDKWGYISLPTSPSWSRDVATALASRDIGVLEHVQDPVIEALLSVWRTSRHLPVPVTLSFERARDAPLPSYMNSPAPNTFSLTSTNETLPDPPHFS